MTDIGFELNFQGAEVQEAIAVTEAIVVEEKAEVVVEEVLRQNVRNSAY